MAWYYLRGTVDRWRLCDIQTVTLPASNTISIMTVSYIILGLDSYQDLVVAYRVGLRCCAYSINHHLTESAYSYPSPYAQSTTASAPIPMLKSIISNPLASTESLTSLFNNQAIAFAMTLDVSLSQ